MTASRIKATVSFLLALLARDAHRLRRRRSASRGPIRPTRSPTPGATPRSAAQNDWDQDSQSRADRADAAERADATDSADRDAEDDDADARESQDRRTVEKYFDWDKDWSHPFSRRHLRSDRHRIER